MYNIIELLDLAKKRNPLLNSDRKLATALNVTQITRYRKRGEIPSDETAIELARLCGLPPEQVLITCHLAKAESGAVHDVWNKVLKMAANACIALILAGSMTALPAPATTSSVHSAIDNNIHYATLICLALLLLITSLIFATKGTL